MAELVVGVNAEDAAVDGAADAAVDGAATSALTSSVADNCTSDELWCSQEIWAESGFLAFLATHDIKRSDLLSGEHNSSIALSERRFFRMKQRSDGSAIDAAEVVQLVTASLERAGCVDMTPEPLTWLPGFFALPATAPLARLDLYRSGALYGIDSSSGFAVSLLDVQPGDHVLDLCCAPGAKLALIADLLQHRGSVTGVDASRARLSACKQLVYKYALEASAAKTLSEGHCDTSAWRCRLFCADGRTFAIGPLTECFGLAENEVLLDTRDVALRQASGCKRKRLNKSARARMRHVAPVLVVNARQYDKVLVDAECTHDGSVRHLQRNDSAAKWRDYVATRLNAAEVTRILALQRDLLRNGFALLRAGGVLVYSTCSLSVQQNEHVVAAFLADHPTAALEPIDCGADVPCENGRIPGTVRFTPARSTSGLFIARLRKREAPLSQSPLLVEPSQGLGTD